MVHIDVPSEERNREESRIFGLIQVLALISRITYSQPLNTHMDLNIGTAFWFASRGVGYIRHYSSDEYQAMYNIEQNGRPLLRLGEEGEKRGKGQHTQKSSVEREKKSGGGSGKNYCAKERCRKISKPGCPFNLCRLCCEKRQLDTETEQTEISALPCPVHRQSTPEIKKTTDDLSNLPQPTQEPQYPSYRSSCKILLVGIGADEQMAGYGRHRTTFQKYGSEGLTQELHSDLTRLWTRNLGR